MFFGLDCDCDVTRKERIPDPPDYPHELPVCLPQIGNRLFMRCDGVREDLFLAETLVVHGWLAV